MREIKYIVCHTTATDQDATIEAIQNYWRNRLGWRNPGYHFIIEADGKITQLQPIDRPSNGVAGYNANSIHISYIGGKDYDDRTEEQKEAMRAVVRTMKAMFPEAEILGHRDFPNVHKSCPRFDAEIEFGDILENVTTQ